MIKQRQMTVKMDLDVLGAMETECLLTGKKRNRIVNDAARFYLRMMDAWRSDKICGTDTKTAAELQRWTDRWENQK